MLNFVKHLRLFSKPKFRLSICNRLQSSLAPSTVSKKSKELPDGIVLEFLNPSTHDLEKVRKLLIDAFVLNQEPVMHALCERAYSGEPMEKKLPKIERHFEKFFSDEFLNEKIELGMSVVAIDKNVSDRYIGCTFVERYCGEIYNTEVPSLRDPFWEHGLRFMSDLQRRACPFLSQYDPEKITFMSHSATCPEYVNSGIQLAIMDLLLSRVAEHGFEIGYCVVTAKSIVKVVENHYGFFPIAEMMYADYEINGEKIFAHLAEKHIAAKAMIKFL
ncbi:Hypothetical predicted protein [Paramuricea clavata]|uniref:Uncharacterized protein n=1 Tax=Paramuricea clavata TaxID=317549 RepID=A0A7D9IE26_PARCT|nr:Hypothetical predicted protein [Paramuricea clavata]